MGLASKLQARSVVMWVVASVMLGVGAPWVLGREAADRRIVVPADEFARPLAAALVPAQGPQRPTIAAPVLTLREAARGSVDFGEERRACRDCHVILADLEPEDTVVTAEDRPVCLRCHPRM